MKPVPVFTRGFNRLSQEEDNMTMLKMFQAVADIATNAAGRVTEEHQEFLKFFRELVETVPPEVAERFGTLKVTALEKGKETEGWGVMLTATDYLFWKQKISDGVRFSPRHGGVKSVPRAMVTRLAKQAETAGLTLEERQKLVKLLDEAA
jgi:hypothetical protein